MSLKQYRIADAAEDFSDDGSFTNPLTKSFDGIVGGVLEVLVYIRNDDAAFYYTDITVQPIDTGDDVVDNAADGYTWKLSAGASQPLEAAWGAIAAGAAASISDLGSSGTPDTATYEPFWVRIEIPSGADVQFFSGVGLRLSFTENVV